MWRESGGSTSTSHSGRGASIGATRANTCSGSAGASAASREARSGGASASVQRPSGCTVMAVPSASHWRAKRAAAPRARSFAYWRERPKPTPIGVKTSCSTPRGLSASVNTPASTKSLRTASNSRSPASCTIGRPR